MKTLKSLILTRQQIEKLVDMREAIRCARDVFRLYGQFRAQMPPKVYLHLEKYHGDFRAMPAYLDGANCCALKWVNVHPGNKAKGLPTVMATVILSDPKNGFPLAVMDGTFITNIRTGAAGAVAARYLARKDSRIIGLVGCGEQAKTQLLALTELFKISLVKVWGYERIYRRNFVKTMKNKVDHLEIADTIKACVEDCDIIVTTTPSRKPLVMLKWLKKGVHINAIGADAKGKQELEPAILKNARLVIDDWPQASHSGEINVALSKKIISQKDVDAELSEIVNGKKKGRCSQWEITVFDSTGLAIQDAAMASIIYRKAKEHRMGRWINLMGL